MPKPTVVAAIANYNMAKELEHLLPQVMQQGYDAVFVLDDASTDNSREVVKKFKGVEFVAGKTNKGAGGNRNRIIKALKRDALIHFLDADVELISENNADLIRQIVPNEPFGFVGGLIKAKTGEPHPWNYGNGVGFNSSVGAYVQLLTFSHKSKLSNFVRHRFKKLLEDWPDPIATPKKRQIFWCTEGNVIFRSDIFARFGGFNETFLETEILDLALRIHKEGLRCYFDPRISVLHTEGKVRPYNRDLLKSKEIFRLSRQLGLKSWFFSDGKPKAGAKS